MLDEIIYYKEIENYPVLSSQKQKELFINLRNGDIYCREKIILGNLKLVLKIVNNFGDYYCHKQDLISEGNIGLMEAVDRFDHMKGISFAFYANFWIRQRILAYLNQKVDIVRLPTIVNQRIRKMNILKEDFYVKYGRYPDDEEICEMLDIKQRSLKVTKESMEINSLKDSYSYLEEYSKEIAENSDYESIEDKEIIFQNIENLKKILELFKGREAEIIYLRFYEKKTLKQIGQKMNVTTERIRQIEYKILKKLKEMLKKFDF